MAVVVLDIFQTERECVQWYQQINYPSDQNNANGHEKFGKHLTALIDTKSCSLACHKIFKSKSNLHVEKQKGQIRLKSKPENKEEKDKATIH